MNKSAFLIPLLIAMAESEGVVVVDKPKPITKRPCKICGDNAQVNSLTCSKKCFIAHKKKVGKR